MQGITMKNPAFVFGAMVLVSAFSLGAALTAEVAFGLEPCVLCIYQRIPFVLGIIIGTIGLLWRRNISAHIGLMIFGSLIFLVNSGIALYHTGVEQKWWTSAVEGCAVPNFAGDPQSFLENILSAPTARCDEIPWADPVFHLSMANYNVLLCLGLAAFFFLAATQVRGNSQ